METPLEHLQASTGGGLDFGFGALPPMANAQHAHGTNVPLHQSVHPIGAGRGTARTVNMVAQGHDENIAERKPILIKVNDTDVWDCNENELYEMLFRWQLNLGRHGLQYAAALVARTLTDEMAYDRRRPVEQRQEIIFQSNLLFAYVVNAFHRKQKKASH